MSDFLFDLDDLPALDEARFERPWRWACGPPMCCPMSRPVNRAARTVDWSLPVETGPSVDDYRPPTQQRTHR